MASATRDESAPVTRFALAQAFLIQAMLTIMSPGRRVCVIGKFSAALSA